VHVGSDASAEAATENVKTPKLLDDAAMGLRQRFSSDQDQGFHPASARFATSAPSKIRFFRHADGQPCAGP
jgi:hypothetical protein